MLKEIVPQNNDIPEVRLWMPEIYDFRIALVFKKLNTEYET
jgi:hypothetical protein